MSEMDDLRLLLIGPAGHHHLLGFAKSLKRTFPDIKLSIISTTNGYTPSSVYDEHFFLLDTSSCLARVRGVRYFYKFYRFYKLLHINRKKIDTILIHFVLEWYQYYIKKLRNSCGNLSICLWGSDYFRAKNQGAVEKVLSGADNIIIGSNQIFFDFKRDYPTWVEKLELCYFGIPPIENLKGLNEKNITREDSCKQFDFTTEKINVTLGHNGIPSHQHVGIINELKKLDSGTLSKFRLILPMSYGLNESYLEEIKNSVKELEAEVCFLLDFMSDEKIAHLRNLTDVMINLQITDAFSGTMREVLFCGGVVINGSWLPYDFLREQGVYYETVDGLSQISSKLKDIVENMDEYRGNCSNNTEVIFKMSSWTKLIYNWKHIIEKKR